MEPKIEGADYWAHVHALENDCERSTFASATFTSEVAMRLGTVTSLLYRLASCHWGCHVITHPLGIVSSYDCLADRVIGAGSSEAFSVDDGAQGGVGLS